MLLNYIYYFIFFFSIYGIIVSYISLISLDKLSHLTQTVYLLNKNLYRHVYHSILETGEGSFSNIGKPVEEDQTEAHNIGNEKIYRKQYLKFSFKYLMEQH